jgi:putative addiction module CopG family antidote
MRYLGAMQLQLPPALESLVRDKVASGRYRDETEVVSEALRLLEPEDEFAWDDPSVGIEEGEADIAAGRTLDFGTADELRAHLSSR